MNFDAATRTKIYVDMDLSYDPTGTTVELNIDGTWYPATWQGSPTPIGSKWTQTALTTGYFAGPAVDAGTVAGATVLAAGNHVTETRVTGGGQVITADARGFKVA